MSENFEASISSGSSSPRSRRSLLVRVPVEGVVVEVHLGVERQQVAAGGDHERIDFDQRGIGGDERVVQRRHQLDRLVDLRAVEADRKADLPRLERHQPDARLDEDLDDLLRRRGGDLLDVHAAGSARHHHRLAGGAIEHEAQIQLARHLQTFLDEDTRHDAPFRAGLMRDERHAEHLAGDALGLVGRSRELHAAALAAAAGVNLRLDDDELAAEAACDLARLGAVERNFTARHGDAVARKDGFGLVLVDFHQWRSNKLLMLTCALSRRNSKLFYRCHRDRASSIRRSARSS